MEKAKAKPTSLYVNGMLALPGLDLELQKLKGENAFEVIDTLTMVPEIKRRIEQVGSAYEKLKIKLHKLREKDEQKK